MIRHLLTDAGAALQGTPWNVYPRPQMVRASGMSMTDFLNTVIENS